MFPFNLFGILCIFILFAFMVSRFWCCFVTLFSATTSCCLDNSFFYLVRTLTHNLAEWVHPGKKFSILILQRKVDACITHKQSKQQSNDEKSFILCVCCKKWLFTGRCLLPFQPIFQAALLFIHFFTFSSFKCMSSGHNINK